MAAEAVLGVVFEKLLSLIQNEFTTIFGIKENAEDLQHTLHSIKVVLEDAEEKEMTNHGSTNKSIKGWLQELKDAMYVLDDILDEYCIKSHRFRGLPSIKPNNLMLSRRIGKRLKKITARFHGIDIRKNQFGLSQQGVVEMKSEVPNPRETSPTIDQPQVHGRDDDKNKIVEFLLNEAHNSHSLSIYPIVGLGGLGKTTLAQLVYNDERVSSHFQIKIWVCVSENFDVKNILRSIIQSFPGEKYDVSTLDAVEKKVKELLQSQSYLLVLDDVWNQNENFKFGLTPEKWDKLKSVLSCGSKGSSILVSTRDMNVAKIMGTYEAHNLSRLSEDDCWLLFKQNAFAHQEEERAELVAIGKRIARKCGGLPLAARALGGTLRTKNEEKEWLRVEESRIWNLPNDNDNPILPILKLSYFHLKPTSKQCFSFCAMFPKDTRIEKEHLIHLWMANGFISD